jgi:LysR family glycine cleavage system transcriptional activator
MNPKTPPLNALKAFASVVRLGSIAKAAEELSLTTGAVAHHIRSLEAFLGIELVSRAGRQLQLTPQGRAYGYQVRQALEDIVDATIHAMSHPPKHYADEVLRISTVPSFIQGWLLHRLPSFRSQHPRIRLFLQASMDFVDLSQGDIDCAIRFGHSTWQHVHTHHLMIDELVLVASPKLLVNLNNHTLKTLLELPVLESNENWSSWLASLPDASVFERPKAVIKLTDSTHLVEAAKLGMGIALTRRSIADACVCSGDLVYAHPHRSLHTASYQLLTPANSSPNPNVQHFKTWLSAQCSAYVST